MSLKRFIVPLWFLLHHCCTAISMKLSHFGEIERLENPFSLNIRLFTPATKRLDLWTDGVNFMTCNITACDVSFLSHYTFVSLIWVWMTKIVTVKLFLILEYDSWKRLRYFVMNQFRAATISFGAWEQHLNIWTPQESKRYESYCMTHTL